MSWNLVLSMVLDIKHDYIEEFYNDYEPVYSYQDSLENEFSNAIEYWVWKLCSVDRSRYQHYNDMIRPLLINQNWNLALIKYDSLGVDWNAYNGLYRECRSVVIDLENECLVLTPFRKFFNIGEQEETQINVIQDKIARAKSIEISDKLDGSMVSARSYNGQLVISGSQALDAAKSFRLEHYYNWFNENPNAIQMLIDYPNRTFIFESIWSKDPHVVQYDTADEGLYLIGMRSVDNGIEADYLEVTETAVEYGVRSVHPLTMTFEQMFDQCRNGDIPSNEAEGYVMSIDGEKFKCKHSNYILMHHAISKILSPNAIMDAIREDRLDDFISMVPEAYRPQADEIVKNIREYVCVMRATVEDWYNSILVEDSLDNRKEVMTWISWHVPSLYQAKVRQMYLGQEIDWLKGIKYRDIKNYLIPVC